MDQIISSIAIPLISGLVPIAVAIIAAAARNMSCAIKKTHINT